MRRPRLLVLVPHFLPGEKAGGPTQSLAGLIERCGSEFDIWLVTSDRDIGETKPLPGVRRGAWMPFEGAHVYYLPWALGGAVRLARLLRRTEYDLLYVNGLFARRSSIWPVFLWRLGLARRVPLVLAPRGELDPGALAIKKWRKAAYLGLTRAIGLYKGVRWQASSVYEKAAITAVIGGGGQVEVAAPISRRTGDSRELPQIVVAKDLARVRRPGEPVRRAKKKPGELRAVFVSRIARKKNLDGAIRMLRGISGRVHLTVYGPLEDEEYWRECQEEASRLPPGMVVEYGGRLPHDAVREAFGRADLFLFPTLGENFGHVIREAFLEGCPVLVSDRTPWRGLEGEGAGWDVPLEDEELFRKLLQHCVDLDDVGHERLVASTRAFGARLEMDGSAIVEHRHLFGDALRQGEREK